MEMQTIVVLLTITVVLLSIVIVSLLAVAIAVLVKVRKIARSLERITTNVASATDWLTPAKVFSEAIKLFRK